MSPEDLVELFGFVIECLRDPVPLVPVLRRENFSFATCFQDFLGNSLFVQEASGFEMTGEWKFILDGLVTEDSIVNEVKAI